MNSPLHAPAVLLKGRVPGTQWAEGWVGSKADLDIVVPAGNRTSTAELVAPYFLISLDVIALSV